MAYSKSSQMLIFGYLNGDVHEYGLQPDFTQFKQQRVFKMSVSKVMVQSDIENKNIYLSSQEVIGTYKGSKLLSLFHDSSEFVSIGFDICRRPDDEVKNDLLTISCTDGTQHVLSICNTNPRMVYNRRTFPLNILPRRLANDVQGSHIVVLTQHRFYRALNTVTEPEEPAAPAKESTEANNSTADKPAESEKKKKKKPDPEFRYLTCLTEECRKFPNYKSHPKLEFATIDNPVPNLHKPELYYGIFLYGSYSKKRNLLLIEDISQTI